MNFSEPVNANAMSLLGPILSLVAGTVTSVSSRIFRGRPVGQKLLRHTGWWTLATSGVYCCSEISYWSTTIRPSANGQGIQWTPWKLVEQSKLPTMDDFMVVGATAGALCASSARRRFPGTITPLAILGAMSIGATAGNMTFMAFNLRRVAKTLENDWETLQRSRELRAQIRAAWYYDSTVDALLGPRSSHIGQMQIQHMQGPPAEPSHEPHQQTSSQGVPLQLPTPHPSLPPPGSGPHAVALVNGETRPWPNTDYYWNPVSRDAGIKDLQDHIEQLQQTRRELATEAEYLWIVIAKKEQKFYTEEDDQQKTVLRKELELLGDIHSRMFQDISGYDWMIADSKKNILQLKNENWVPEARSQEVQDHSPERTLKLIRNHLDNLKDMVKMTDQGLVPEDAPADIKDQIEKQHEFLKTNTTATATLMREFEDYVQHGRDLAREAYLNSKSETPK